MCTEREILQKTVGPKGIVFMKQLYETTIYVSVYISYCCFIHETAITQTLQMLFCTVMKIWEISCEKIFPIKSKLIYFVSYESVDVGAKIRLLYSV